MGQAQPLLVRLRGQQFCRDQVQSPLLSFSMEKKVTTHKPLAVLGAGTGAPRETFPPCLGSGSSCTSESTGGVSQLLAENFTHGEEPLEYGRGPRRP